MSNIDQTTAVPTYSRVIDNSKDYVAPVTEQQQVQAGQQGQDQAGQQGQDQAGQQGQDQAGQQGQDQAGQQGQDFMGEIRSTLASLSQQIAGQGQQGQQGQQVADPNADLAMKIEQQLSDLQEKATAGEITYAEMIRQTAPLLSEQARLQVKNDLNQEKEAEQIRGAQDAFLAEHPDFMDFVKSPEAQAIRQANPIMDNVSAYFAYQANMAKAATGQLQTEMQNLQTQMQNSIKGAAQQQAPVVGAGNGGAMQVPLTSRGDGRKPLEGGLAALQGVRSKNQ